MKSLKGKVNGITVAKYRKDGVTWTCKISGKFYCAEFHNGRYSITTYYSEDKNEINELIKKEILNGFKRVQC